MQAGDDTVAHLAKYVDDNVAKRLDEFKAQGITVYDIPAETMTVLEKALADAESDWVRRMADRGLPAEKTLADFKAAMEE